MYIPEIPSVLLVPGHYQQIDASLAGSTDEVKRVLVVGIKSSYGTATPGKAVPISSLSKARNLLGEGSPACTMVKNFLELNRTESLFVLPIAENPSGTQAVRKLTFSASACESGSFTRLVGGVRVQMGVLKNDTAVALASRFVAVLNSCADIEVQASIDPTQPSCVVLTSCVKGEVGNQVLVCRVSYDVDPQGVSVTDVLIPGTLNPDIRNVVRSLGSVRYHFWISDLVDLANIQSFIEELDDRYSATRQIGGRLFLPLSGIVGDSASVGSMIAQSSLINCPHVVLLPRGLNAHSPGVWVSRMASIAIRALGEDPAANTQGLLVAGLLGDDNWDPEVRQKMLLAGIATWKCNPTGWVLIERLVTSYKVNDYGDRDTSYLDVQVVETVESIRAKINATAAKRFQKWKLAATNENFGSGSLVMTAEIWKAFLVEMYQKYFILEKQWCQNLEAYKSSLIVEMVPGNKTRLNYQHRPILVSPLYITAGLVQFT